MCLKSIGLTTFGKSYPKHDLKEGGPWPRSCWVSRSCCWPLMCELSSVVWGWLLLSVRKEDFVGSMEGQRVYIDSVLNVLLYRFRSRLLLCARNGQSRPNADSE